MSEGKRFSRESFVYVVGEFLSKSLTFLLLPIYASYLSIEDFATLSIVNVIWPVVIILLGRGFSAFILRGYHDYDDKKGFFGTIILFSMGTGLFSTLAIHGLGPVLARSIFKDMTYRPYLQYGIYFACFRLFFNHVISLFRAKRDALTSVLLSVVQFLSHSAAVIIAVFVFRSDLSGILHAQLLAYALVAVLFLIRILPEISLKIQAGIIRPAILFTLPLIPHALSMWVLNYVSRIFIERGMTPLDLSAFTVVSQLGMILGIVNYGLNQAWAPFVYANAERPDLRELISFNGKKILVFVLLIGGVLVLFIQEFLLLMGKSEYALAENAFPLFIVSYLFQMLYFIHVTILVHHKNTKMLPFITAVSGGLCIGMNVLLIPPWGIYGAAAATLAGFLAMFLLSLAASRVYVKLSLWDGRIVAVLLLFVSGILISRLFIAPLPVAIRIGLKLSMTALFVKSLEWLRFMHIKEFIVSVLNREYGLR